MIPEDDSQEDSQDEKEIAKRMTLVCRYKAHRK